MFLCHDIYGSLKQKLSFKHLHGQSQSSFNHTLNTNKRRLLCKHGQPLALWPATSCIHTSDFAAKTIAGSTVSILSGMCAFRKPFSK